MVLWTIFALFFIALALILAYFTWLPDRLLALHQYLTGRDAASELDRASYTFLRLTRRLCAIPAIICLVIGVRFVQAAVRAANEHPANVQHDQKRFEDIRRHGVGSLLSQQPNQIAAPRPGAPAAPGSPRK